LRTAVFVDTSYFLALLNSRDKYHEAAKAAAEKVSPPFVTSEAVLFEVGNALARPSHRILGIQTLKQIRADRQIEVVHISPELFDETVAFYRVRMDKGWGLTDCSSFVIMRQMGIGAALTADIHFEQAGFERLVQ